MKTPDTIISLIKEAIKEVIQEIEYAFDPAEETPSEIKRKEAIRHEKEKRKAAAREQALKIIAGLAYEDRLLFNQRRKDYSDALRNNWERVYDEEAGEWWLTSSGKSLDTKIKELKEKYKDLPDDPEIENDLNLYVPDSIEERRKKKKKKQSRKRRAAGYFYPMAGGWYGQDGGDGAGDGGGGGE